MHARTKALVFAAAALALTACGGSSPVTVLVRVPASELPGLGPSTYRADVPARAVKTIDGSMHQISGPIRQVEIDMKDQKIVPVALPFKARVLGDELEVLTDQVRTYSVPNISFVQIQYQGGASQRGGGASAGLMVGGLVPLGLGVALLLEGSGHSGGGGLGGIVPLMGGALAIAGAGLFIAGVSVGNRDPAPQPKKTTTIRPQLRFSPTGGTFSFDF